VSPNFKTKRGRLGEVIALRELQDLGHIILFTNYRNRFAEIDIISFFDGGLHFFEVKTWSEQDSYHPFFSLNETKQRKMRKSYLYLTQMIPAFSHLTVSFDLIHITEKTEVIFYYSLF